MTGASPPDLQRPPATGAPPAEVLSVRGLSKRFGDVQAADAMDLDFYPGEVHAVLGENGAGKSTLMKMLYGYYHPDSGRILLDDRAVTPASPAVARRLGIGMVFQNFTLVPALTVTENIALMLPALPFLLPIAALAQEVRALSDRYGFGIDPRARVRDLSMGEQQKVEILKLLLAQARFLIFDEPTSVLAPHEIDGLLDVFRRLRTDGLAVLFITHKLREVLAVADRVSVLRRGAVVATLPAASATEANLVTLMLGAADGAGTPGANGEGMPLITGQTRSPAPRPASTAPVPLVEVINADVPDPAGRVHLYDITLSLYPGEIVGVAAVAGNGQKELGDFIAGLRPCRSGSLRIKSEDAAGWGPARTMAAGVGCLPEDPLRMGAVPAMTVLENMILSQRDKYTTEGGFTVRWKAARSDLRQAVSRFKLKFPGLDARAEVLSGGNIQRVVFLRELVRDPQLLLCYYPTRGMDVPTAAIARELLLAHRDNGNAILLVSEDLDELFALSDRLIVMHHGRIAGTFRPEETTAHAVGYLMTGAGGDDDRGS